MDLKRRQESGERIYTGTPTGFTAFDREYGGLPRTLVVLGADTGIGKSSVALSMALGAAASGVGYVYVANIEDGNVNTADRVIGQATGLGGNKVRKLDWRRGEMEPRFSSVGGAWQGALDKIYFNDELNDAEAIATHVLKFADKYPLALTVVDYLQLLRVKGAGNNNDRVIKALDVLVSLVKATNAPVLALSQVTTKKIMERGREYYYKAKSAGETGDDCYAGFIPERGDFHWASEIDMYAKMIISAFRVGPYRRDIEGGNAADNRMYLPVIKNNFGPCRKFTVGWDGPLNRVYDLGGDDGR